MNESTSSVKWEVKSEIILGKEEAVAEENAEWCQLAQGTSRELCNTSWFNSASILLLPQKPPNSLPSFTHSLNVSKLTFVAYNQNNSNMPLLC